MGGRIKQIGVANIAANHMQSGMRYLADLTGKSASTTDFRSMCAGSIMRNYMQIAPSGHRERTKGYAGTTSNNTRAN